MTAQEEMWATQVNAFGVKMDLKVKEISPL